MAQQSQKDFGNNVIDLFSNQPFTGQCSQQILRLSPELDNLEMLYSNTTHADKIFSMKILCWAIRDNGQVSALIPWLHNIVDGTQINDPLDGQWH